MSWLKLRQLASSTEALLGPQSPDAAMCDLKEALGARPPEPCSSSEDFAAIR